MHQSGPNMAVANPRRRNGSGTVALATARNAEGIILRRRSDSTVDLHLASTAYITKIVCVYFLLLFPSFSLALGFLDSLCACAPFDLAPVPLIQ